MTDATRPAMAFDAPVAPSPIDPQWLNRFARPELWAAHAYDASHHDFAWQHRELARLMSNECPLPPDDVVIEAVVAAMRDGKLYPNSAWELRDALAEFAGVAPGCVILDFHIDPEANVYPMIPSGMSVHEMIEEE